jgi:hypothetical protein
MSDQHVAEAATYTAHNNHKKETYISGIRTRDPGNQATADLRLRPDSHQTVITTTHLTVK